MMMVGGIFFCTVAVAVAAITWNRTSTVVVAIAVGSSGCPIDFDLCSVYYSVVELLQGKG